MRGVGGVSCFRVIFVSTTCQPCGSFHGSQIQFLKKRKGSGWERTWFQRNKTKQSQSRTNCNLISTNREAKDLEDLSSLGHFLKGSSATLGFNKIRDSCNVIQQYGHGLNVDGTNEPNKEVCLKKITEALSKVKVDTEELEKQMKKFFNVAE